MKGFTEDEARQIFARAAERQHAVEARGEGLSVEELQEIGLSAGLDPEHVAAAVAELRAGPPHEPERVAGADVAPRRSRVLPGAVSDETWGQMVGRFRRTFGAAGITTEFGRVREWTSGETSNLRVLAEPVEDGTRVTIESRRDDASQAAWMGPAFGTGATLFFLAIGAATGKLSDPVMWVFIVLFASLAVLGGVWGRRSIRGWSETRQSQFDTLLDQFELAQRQPLEAEAPAGGPSAAEAVPTALDLDTLADPGVEREDAPPNRTRTRS